jgi:hypothetical protein
MHDVTIAGGSRGIDAGYPDAPFVGTAVEGLAVTDCDFTTRTSGEDLKVSAVCDYVRTDRNLWSSGVNDEHDAGPSATADLGKNNIYTDLSRNPFGDRGPFIDLGVLAANVTVPIDLDKGNYYRIKATWGGGAEIVGLGFPTSSWGIKAGQKLTLDCEIGLIAPAAGGGFNTGLVGTAWAPGQGDILTVPADGAWGYIQDNAVGSEAAGGMVDNNANKTFINNTAGTHTVITFVYDGATWRAVSRKVSKA